MAFFKTFKTCKIKTPFLSSAPNIRTIIATMGSRLPPFVPLIRVAWKRR